MLSQQLIISFRPMQALRQTFISKRPVASFLTASLAGGISYAFFIEQKANTKVSSSSLLAGGGITSIPREYDRDAIADYWKQRPISVVSRIGMIGYEFIPLLSNYIIDFKIFNHKNNDLDRQQETYISHAAKLRQALTNLGPAFIKFGQQISIRPDLLPAPVLKELQKLCDAVEPIPDHIAMQTLMQEIGQETLDKCLLHPSSKMELVAAASLGQVYKTTLKSGQNVALKIQRPDMIQKVSLDLFLLNQYGLLLDTIFEVLTNQIPFHVNFIDCFARASFEELDYEKEAKNQLFFRKEFEKRKCQVHIPLVFDQLTTRRVICSEWIDGVKLADAGQDTIRRLIPVGVELFMTQLLDIGAFHADPHPGNLYVTNKGVLCLLDFGLCAQIDPLSRKALTTAIVHLLTGDFDSLIARDAKDLGFLPEEMDVTELKPILTKILAEGLLESGSNLHARKRNLMNISNELNEVFFQYPFSVPPFFALITRGLGLLEGIALSGDSDFDIFQASYPYARKRAVKIYGVHRFGRLQRKLTEMK